MPDIIIVPLRDIPGATEATTATFEAIAMRSPASSSVRVAGAEVTFPDTIHAKYVGGAWDVQPALVSLPVGDYWKVTLTDITTSKVLRRTVILPMGDGPFDFEQLIDITPTTGQVDPNIPIWEAIVAEIAAIRDEILANTVTASVDPEDPDVLILNFPVFQTDPDDDYILILPIGA